MNSFKNLVYVVYFLSMGHFARAGEVVAAGEVKGENGINGAAVITYVSPAGSDTVLFANEPVDPASKTIYIHIDGGGDCDDETLSLNNYKLYCLAKASAKHKANRQIMNQVKTGMVDAEEQNMICGN